MRVKAQKLSMFIYSLVGLLLIVLFTNCSQMSFQGVKEPSRFHSNNSGNGNGDYYTGKPGFYDVHIAGSFCQQRTAAGAHLPNRQIMLQNGEYTLVRNECADVHPPRVIPRADLEVDLATDKLVYQGMAFAFVADPSRYDLTQITCADGQLADTTELFESPLDLSYTSFRSGWSWLRPEIIGILDGSLSALPRYKVVTNTSNPAWLYDWYRLGQLRSDLKPGTDYAVKFYLQPGNLNKATVTLFASDIVSQDLVMKQGFRIGFDLQGAGSVDYIQENPQVIKASIRASGNGYIATVYFKTGTAAPGETLGYDIGFAGTRDFASGNVEQGDYIYAASGSWKEVSPSCAP